MRRFFTFLLAAAFPTIFAFSQTISTVTPGTAIQGQTIQVSISGQNTYFQQGSSTTWLTQGPDAILASVNSVLSWTSLNSVYQIPSNAGVGYWDLHVLDGIQGELLKPDAIFIDQFIGTDPRSQDVKESIQLSPNPATDHFVLKYALPSKSRVTIQVRDLKGQIVAPIFTGDQSPGSHELTVELAQLRLPASVFLVTLQVDDMVFAVKTTVLR